MLHRDTTVEIARRLVGLERIVVFVAADLIDHRTIDAPINRLHHDTRADSFTVATDGRRRLRGSF